jgi:molecular chaperone GrpE (heat shock protein)
MSKNTQTANSKQQTDDSVIPEKSGIQSNDLSEANQLIAELTSDLQRIQAEFNSAIS